MNTMLFYDNDGIIHKEISGDYAKPNGGVQYLEIQIPDGKRVVSIDTSATPHVPVYEDLPIDPIEKLKSDVSSQIQSTQDSMDGAICELTMMLSMIMGGF